MNSQQPTDVGNAGVQADPVFAGMTRPPMRFGVSYTALLVNLVVTMEFFLLTRNLLVLLLAVPLHGLFALLCARDERIFELTQLWMRTGLLSYFGNRFYWGASSYSPLLLDVPNRKCRRRAAPQVLVGHAGRGQC